MVVTQAQDGDPCPGSAEIGRRKVISVKRCVYRVLLNRWYLRSAPTPRMAACQIEDDKLSYVYETGVSVSRCIPGRKLTSRLFSPSLFDCCGFEALPHPKPRAQIHSRRLTWPRQSWHIIFERLPRLFALLLTRLRMFSESARYACARRSAISVDMCSPFEVKKS